ncbi:LacI family DNA-binding transcriptional regulator [Cohnella luojiensis]|uniref:LacI family transcriptional regulator n=1 Tax=Cohnella luojiensis TaxID=652876 RepID=A0A4Y8LQQ8_9BACL|nr:LacI family DNA-binding transcriptional regulator [Cohnella luojiensis]TFE22850.1 LacI family transcriptional regulator [Cohnella luojiensis]
MTPTIKDIAKAAEVSVTTVSRALNGYTDVNEETKKKILRIADELKYSPNIAARSLIVKKTKTLGLLLSGITRSSIKDNIAFEILCGMNDRSGELDYDLVLFNTTSQKQRMKSYKSLCLERGVDGVIIMGIRLDDPYLQEIVQSSIPCVLIDIPLAEKNVGSVSTDNVSGAYQATEHLIRGGHKHIGFINGHAQAYVSIKRLEGYRLALLDHDIEYREEFIADGSFSENGGYESAIMLATKHPEITALFCASDLMAIGAIQGLKNIGKTVPENVSIVGFDNIAISGYCSPTLTTIHQNKYDMGYRAAQMLVDMLEGRQVHPHLTLPAELVERQSVRILS